MNINTKFSLNKYLQSNKILGFWIYLMSDFIFFSVIFSVFFVLKQHSSNFFLEKKIFSRYLIIIKTYILLFNSFICNILNYKIFKINSKIQINKFLFSILILGISFLFIEFIEIYRLISFGYVPKKNSFFSSFFVLTGSHDIRIISGIIWTIVVFLQVYFSNLKYYNRIQIRCLCIFWNFIDIIWTFIFIFVYLPGKIL